MNGEQRRGLRTNVLRNAPKHVSGLRDLLGVVLDDILTDEQLADLDRKAQQQASREAARERSWRAA